jgi:hypothetical protein
MEVPAVIRVHHQSRSLFQSKNHLQSRSLLRNNPEVRVVV